MENRKPVQQVLGPVVEVLAPLGWATHGRWHANETTRLVALANAGAPGHEIDELVTDLWHSKNSRVWLKNVSAPLRRYGRGIDHEFQRQQFQRAHLVDEAVACHLAGYYAAATLLTYAQTDGLTRDVTGASFFSHSRNDPYLDDETLAGVEGNLPVVRQFFTEDVDSTGFHGKLSRHGATHGRDLSFGSRITSTKALVLLGALIEYLEERAAKVARGERRARERAARNRDGVDEHGRRLDDRHFDALYFFQADLSTQMLRNIMIDGTSADQWENQARELLLNRHLSWRRCVWGGAEDESFWWYYQTPSGQYLGAGSRLYGRGRPIDWRTWLWDSSSKPTGSPWESDDWFEYDGNNPTPNWGIDEFPTV